MGKNLDRILELAPCAKLLRQEVATLREQKQRRQSLGVDAASLDREIETREAELRTVEAEMAPLLAQDAAAPAPTPPPAPQPPVQPHTPVVAARPVQQPVQKDSRGARALARINAQPGHLFAIGDFVNICGSKAAAGKMLWRLAMEQHLIERVGKGRDVHFRALDSKRVAATPPARPAAPAVQTNGAASFRAPNPSQPTGQDNVLAFMEQHQGTWLKAAAINRGMGLPSDRTVSVISALNRLVKKGALQKDNNARFCLPSPTRGDLEVASR